MGAIYIIDSGISDSVSKIYSNLCCFKFQYAIKDAFHSPEIEKHLTSNDFHGDIVYRIITKSKSTCSEIYSFKILDHNLSASYAQLEKALEIILSINIKGIINLSLGLVDSGYRKKLSKYIEQLEACGIFIVCATSTYDSYPMLLPNVIRVSDAEFINRLDDESKFKRYVDFIYDVNKETCPFMPLNYPSYAAPFISALASDLIENYSINSIHMLKESLQEHYKGAKNA